MPPSIKNITQLKELIQFHDGIFELQSFGKNFESSCLDDTKLKIFMATLWAFFRETPSGILSLALRVYDYWSDINEWGAMGKSAYILSTAVDEFGLDNIQKNFSPTHHLLFKETTEYFQISEIDLLSYQNILPAGRKIGKASISYYRKKPLPVSLGFHLASELTSWLEFNIFLSGFWANKDYYNLTSQKNTPLKFFWIHTILEPAHLTHSEKILEEYLRMNPGSIEHVASGALHYMKLYEKLFKELNKRLFN